MTTDPRPEWTLHIVSNTHWDREWYFSKEKMNPIKRLWLLWLVTSILLASCSSGKQLKIGVTLTTSPSSTRTSPTPPEAYRTSTPAAAINPTLTLKTPRSFSPVKTTFQESGDWNLSLPYSDPTISGIIQASPDGYQLDRSFQVETIEMSFAWGGLGVDPIQEYQRIDRRGVDYWKGSTQVSTKAVRDLIKSISHLHLQPQMVDSITHTDDYPHWTIEIKNNRGNTVFLYTDSNTENFAPWNVIYNGQIFAQFDGQITHAISNFSHVMPGQPQASYWSGDGEKGYINIESIGWPGQLTDGYHGLLALGGGFHYWTDPQKGELQGDVKGSYSVVGSIITLSKVEIDGVKGQTISCSLEAIDSSNPDYHNWHFVCPLGQQNISGTYRYPIRVTFLTRTGRAYTQSGELFGNWQQGLDIANKQVPEEIEPILQSSPTFRDLLSDHQLSVVEFQGLVDPAKGKMDHQWSATVAFLGQVKIDNQVIRYTATSNVSIENSKLVQWDFDRQKLQALLEDVLDQAVTHRFVNGTHDLILNLFYKETLDDNMNRRMHLRECTNIPGPTEGAYPSKQQPLRGFGFNQSWGFYGPQALLFNAKPRLLDIRIQRSAPEDAIWDSILPGELQPADVPPFQDIYFYDSIQTVSIIWRENASEVNIEKYNALAKTLPGQKEMFPWGFEIVPAALNINTEGTLSLIECVPIK